MEPQVHSLYNFPVFCSTELLTPLGDSSVFKKRGIPEKPLGLPPRMPRILKIVVDWSGSMYRFNSTEMRLQRSMDAVVMLLESLHGREQVRHHAFLVCRRSCHL